MGNSARFSGVYIVFEVFQVTWRSNKESPSVYWTDTLVVSFNGLKSCKFVSRSDLVLHADFLGALEAQFQESLKEFERNLRKGW